MVTCAGPEQLVREGIVSEQLRCRAFRQVLLYQQVVYVAVTGGAHLAAHRRATWLLTRAHEQLCNRLGVRGSVACSKKSEAGEQPMKLERAPKPPSHIRTMDQSDADIKCVTVCATAPVAVEKAEGHAHESVKRVWSATSVQ
eukprot:4211651-Pyramimonas_sp.AAC.1